VLETRELCSRPISPGVGAGFGARVGAGVGAGVGAEEYVWSRIKEIQRAGARARIASIFVRLRQMRRGKLL